MSTLGDYGASASVPTESEDAAVIAALRAEVGDLLERLARYEEPHYSQMPDEDLGRAFRAFATTVEKWSGEEWRDAGERRLGLMQLGLREAVRMAVESNAETFTTTFHGFSVLGEPHGDWRVTIAKAPA